MHLSERRAARVRSRGEGTPPWRVWPREAERASKRSLPSSLKILVRVSVVYTEEDFSALLIVDIKISQQVVLKGEGGERKKKG